MEKNANQQDSSNVTSSAAPALQRGLAILNMFSQGRQAISVAEISEALSIPRASAFRLVNTMVDAGFLIRDQHRSVVLLGHQVMRLGLTYLHGQDFLNAARPHIQKLRDQLSSSTHLALLDGRHAVYVLRTTSGQNTGDWSRIGHRLPAHASGCGRALLFDHTPKQLQSMFGDSTLEKYSSQTPSTLDELNSVLSKEREQGFVSYRSAVTPGVASCAAPVRNHAGQIVASISASDLQSIPKLNDLEGEVAMAVLATCKKVSTELGYDYSSS